METKIFKEQFMKLKFAKQSILLAALSIIGASTLILPAEQANAAGYNYKNQQFFSSAVSHQKMATAPAHPNKEYQTTIIAYKISNTTTGLSPNLVELALSGYYWALKQGRVSKKDYLTIVNFSLPSKEKRLWVIHLPNQHVVMKTFVANGKNSGFLKGTRFSNTPGSLESSLGIYVTGSTYYGSKGLSMHVYGLQTGVNNNAYRRLIEFHGAPYVNSLVAKEYGRVGRSWGCFALDNTILPKVLDWIKGGSVVFAYANDHNYDYRPYAIA